MCLVHTTGFILEIKINKNQLHSCYINQYMLSNFSY